MIFQNCSLRSIYITGAAGMTKSSMRIDNQGRSHVCYVHVMWTPRQHDQGTHLICGSAEDKYQWVYDIKSLAHKDAYDVICQVKLF
jgi:hypothetical protein